MVAYAPSDVQTVTVNPPHGCGQPHVRDTTDTWIVNCGPCNKHLTSVLGWGGTKSEAPETYDEKLQREDRERRGSQELEKATGDAMTEIAKMPGALEKLAAILAGQAPSEVVRCTQGHANPVAARFCSDCGAPMGELISAMVPDAPQAALSAPQPSPRASGKRKPLKDMRADDMKALARQKGLSDDGTRLQVLERIRAAR